MEFFVMQKNGLDMKSKQITIDLNADLGEYQSENQYFTECEILSHISSCNIACGGHAGDEAVSYTHLTLPAILLV